MADEKPATTIETITVTRPLKVIAYTCGFVTTLVLVAAASTTDWIMADGWREGLFQQCIELGAPTPLPFEVDPVAECRRAHDAGWLRGVAALMIIAIFTDFFGTLCTGLGLRSTDPNKKYKYYRVAIYSLLVAFIALLIALIVYPVSLSKDIANTSPFDGGRVKPYVYKGSLDFDGDGILDHLDDDDDNDGIKDELDPDDDNDGILDEKDTDDDNDGILDVNEGDDDDFDNDGIPDSIDDDDDGDGIPDTKDNDDDNDGIPDSIDEDDDNDGIPDGLDDDADGDGIADAYDNDDDNDGIDDSVDTDDDGDGIPDTEEDEQPEDNDDDDDGIPDDEDDDDDGDGIPDTEDLDDDGDGIPDVMEIDSDGDGVPDAADRDDDNDGILDEEDDDDDGDGIPDEEETVGKPRVWMFGFGYGASWGCCFLLFVAVVMLICDRESEEIFYKERAIEDEEAGEGDEE